MATLTLMVNKFDAIKIYEIAESGNTEARIKSVISQCV